MPPLMNVNRAKCNRVGPRARASRGECRRLGPLAERPVVAPARSAGADLIQFSMTCVTGEELCDGGKLMKANRLYMSIM